VLRKINGNCMEKYLRKYMANDLETALKIEMNIASKKLNI
jgi:hypothetical protein